MSPLEALGFVSLGLVVGAYGTLVGLGGGFVIVPVLLLFYHVSPQAAVGTSLTVIFFNALSGSLSYARQRRIDYATGWRFGLATLPGAALGAYLSAYLTSRPFNFAFGLLLCAVAAFLIWKPELPTGEGPAVVNALPVGKVSRQIVDGEGKVFRYSFSQRKGILLSFLVGFLSSILGIGGGIIHVPALIHLFSFPAHVAVATSIFILTITAGAGSAFHLGLGNVLTGPAIFMSVGVVVGAQAGAALGRRLRGAWIIRLLSMALFVVGVRLLLGVFMGGF